MKNGKKALVRKKTLSPIEKFENSLLIRSSDHSTYKDLQTESPFWPDEQMEKQIREDWHKMNGMG